MDMEDTKIFGALLTAGIVCWLAWFVSHQLYHPHHLEKNAFEIAVAESSGGETVAEQTEPEPIDVDKADVATGEKLSKICASCHTFDNGGANKVGPNLFGVVGGPHAHKGDYPYSDAMKGEAGKKWDREALNKFLWSPRKAVPGTKMTFMGFKKPEERAAVIKWLETQK